MRLLTLLLGFSLMLTLQAKDKPLKVYILVGQSNMQGTGHVKTLAHMKEDSVTKPLHDKIVDSSGKFITYKNVHVAAVSEGKGRVPTHKNGPLTVGFGSGLTKPDVCGPELGFGINAAEKLKEPILIIKASWGGKSIYHDFRPVSAGPVPLNDKQKSMSDEKKQELIKNTGHYYRLMTAHVKKVLADPGKYHPDYNKSAGYEIAGFAWFQGWNDMVNGGAYPDRYKPGGYAAYTEVLAHFIRDVRKDFNAPKMPFAIGVMGVGGPTKDYESKRYQGVHQYFRDAMAAPASMPEFKGNVKAVLTEKFWPKDVENAEKNKRAKKELTEREKWLMENGRSNAGFHYLGSLKCYSQIGEALANALIEMK